MTYEKYGSDVIVDMMRAYEIPYVSLNPGATFTSPTATPRHQAGLSRSHAVTSSGRAAL